MRCRGVRLQISTKIKKRDLCLKTASGWQRPRRTQNSFTNAPVLDFTVQRDERGLERAGKNAFFSEPIE